MLPMWGLGARNESKTKRNEIKFKLSFVSTSWSVVILVVFSMVSKYDAPIQSWSKSGVTAYFWLKIGHFGHIFWELDIIIKRQPHLEVNQTKIDHFILSTTKMAMESRYKWRHHLRKGGGLGKDEAWCRGEECRAKDDVTF